VLEEPDGLCEILLTHEGLGHVEHQVAEQLDVGLEDLLGNRLKNRKNPRTNRFKTGKIRVKTV
jgi:hypothetical protein